MKIILKKITFVKSVKFSLHLGLVKICVTDFTLMQKKKGVKVLLIQLVLAIFRLLLAQWMSAEPVVIIREKQSL